MNRRPQRYTRTETLFPETTLCRSLAVAGPERELRQGAPRERRLLARDRVQRDLGPRNDLLAIFARDPGMVLDPLGLKPLFGHPRCSRPDLVLRLKEIGRATSELQSLMRISYAVFCLKKKKHKKTQIIQQTNYVRPSR